MSEISNAEHLRGLTEDMMEGAPYTARWSRKFRGDDDQSASNPSVFQLEIAHDVLDTYPPTKPRAESSDLASCTTVGLLFQDHLGQSGLSHDQIATVDLSINEAGSALCNSSPFIWRSSDEMETYFDYIDKKYTECFRDLLTFILCLDVAYEEKADDLPMPYATQLDIIDIVKDLNDIYSQPNVNVLDNTVATFQPKLLMAATRLGNTKATVSRHFTRDIADEQLHIVKRLFIDSPYDITDTITHTFTQNDEVVQEQLHIFENDQINVWSIRSPVSAKHKQPLAEEGSPAAENEIEHFMETLEDDDWREVEQ